MEQGTSRANQFAPVASGDVQVARALLSVSDKTGIVEFARGLAELGIEIVSTGGTAGELADAGLEVRSISDLTGFPEIMDGRVKTLHPKLYGGLLALRDDPAHMRAAEEHDVEFVDLVCVNLYPFERTAARRGVGDPEVIENIDIGGPTMIRAAAKNFAVRRAGRQPRELRRGARRAARVRPPAVADDARDPRRRGVRLHRALRHRDRALVPGEGRGLPGAAGARVREGARAPLRREPPPARRLLLAGRRAHPRALDGLPARRQGALVQQPARSRRRPPARERVPDPRVRDRQAQQPLRRRRRQDRARGLPAGVRLRSRCRPTAA